MSVDDSAAPESGRFAEVGREDAEPPGAQRIFRVTETPKKSIEIMFNMMFIMFNTMFIV